MAESGVSGAVRQVLPSIIEVLPGRDPGSSHSRTVTLLQPLPSINISALPWDFAETRTVFQLLKDIAATMDSKLYFAKVQKRASDKDWRLGIVYHMREAYYGLIELDKDMTSKELRGKHDEESSVLFSSAEDYLSHWRMEPVLMPSDVTLDRRISTFSMAPPARDSVNSVNILRSPKSQKDPLKFIYSRYYSILYSLNTPLSYFPKTALSRFKNLCENDDARIKSVLQKLYVPVAQLDTRHEGKYGILRSINNNDTDVQNGPAAKEFEEEHEKDFVSRHSDLIAKEQDNDDPRAAELLNKLVLELKVREAQLQILVVLDLIFAWGVEEESFLSEGLKQQEKEFRKLQKLNKQSLVRKKSNKRKIMPTFLGMGINVSEPERPVQDMEINEYSLYNSLTTLVDRMGIWDTLLGKAPGEEEDSSYGFLVYVLVPYYNKKLPLIIKFIIDKVKALNPKLVASKPHRSKSESSKSTGSLDRPLKRSKVALSRKPKLTQASTSDLQNSNDDLLPAFSLKRSKSNLSSKNLQRRQVDMSVNLKSTEDANAEDQLLEKRLNSIPDLGLKFIFGNAKKIKPISLPAPVLLRTESVSQVQATPAKKRVKDIHIPEVISTPFARSKSSTLPLRTPETFAQPRKDVPNTIQKQSLSDKLLKVISMPQAELKSPINITSSPEHAKRTSSHVVQSSPIKVPNSVESSGARKRARPGEPMSIEDSPFFKANLNGSPTYRSRTDVRPTRPTRAKLANPVPKEPVPKEPVPTEVPTDHDGSPFDGNSESDSDSDYERLVNSSKASTKIRTYSRLI